MSLIKPDRNLVFDMVRITEAAAISAAKYIGSGDKNAGDQAAVDAMREVLRKTPINGTIIIGEGAKDEAPMLFNGEKVGSGDGAHMDIAVDPVEGTNLLAYDRPNSIAVLAMSEAGSMWNPGDSLYMNKIVVEEKAKNAIDITLSTAENLSAIALALEKKVEDLTIFLLDKPRHKNLIQEIREAGARISLQTDGDVMGALQAATPNSGIDVLMGIGGTPEGVISAAAVKALNGGMQGMRAPQLQSEKDALVKAKIRLDEVLQLNDLINSKEALFAASGITGGSFLNGVNNQELGFVTVYSLAIRASENSIQHIKSKYPVK
jgi:fructose-1,6-bisphosphatase II